MTYPKHTSNKTTTESLQNITITKFTESNNKQNQTDLQQDRNSNLRQFGANMVRVNDNDPDLAILLKAWPELPEHIKEAIKALVQAHSKRGNI